MHPNPAAVFVDITARAERSPAETASASDQFGEIYVTFVSDVCVPCTKSRIAVKLYVEPVAAYHSLKGAKMRFDALG